MGEVYRARDTRLDRLVAIKILPAALAADPQFRERFDREARAISQLEHPHICALYDVGEQDGTAYLVMQHLEGETLARRLEHGALPLHDALTIATEIAGALDEAHRSGIVHRDLKPGNVMLTKSGAKLLDFGLAKTGVTAAAGRASMLPTTPPELTAAGAILGTFQYMSPEQLEGKDADARSDIFAFGALVYEMATGRKAFEGKSQASLIAAILDRDPPPIGTLQPLAPHALEGVVRQCLAKAPDDRWQSAHDLVTELKWIAEGVSESRSPTSRPAAKRREILTGAAGLAVGALAAGLAVWLVGRGSGSARSVHVAIPFDTIATISTPGATNPLAISPDGQYIALSAVRDGTRRLYIRSVFESTVREISEPKTPTAHSFRLTANGLHSSRTALLNESHLQAEHHRRLCPRPACEVRLGDRTGSSFFHGPSRLDCRACLRAAERSRR